MLGVDGEGAEVAVVQADETGLGGEGGLQLALVVRFDQRLEAELARQTGEPGQLGGREDACQQQHEVGAGGPKDRQLALVDDELFGEDRDRHCSAHDPEIGDVAAEPVRLAQDGDRARAAGLVGAGECHGISTNGDRSCRRRAALDLGDEVQPGRGEALGDGPWRAAGFRRRLGRVVRQAAVAALAQLPLYVPAAALGDLGHDAGAGRTRGRIA